MNNLETYNSYRTPLFSTVLCLFSRHLQTFHCFYEGVTVIVINTDKDHYIRIYVWKIMRSPRYESSPLNSILFKKVLRCRKSQTYENIP